MLQLKLLKDALADQKSDLRDQKLITDRQK